MGHKIIAATITVLALGLTACSGGNGHSAYHWVDWSEAGEDGAAGEAAGITITYFGDLNANSTADNTAEDLFTPWADSFTHEDVGPAPAGGDILRMYGGEDTGPQILTFSAPVQDPVLAIVSLGSTSNPARLAFNSDITVLTSGPGKWGGSTGGLTIGEDGTTLFGQEAYGLVRVEGIYERISFEIPDYEADYGVQLAVRHRSESRA